MHRSGTTYFANTLGSLQGISGFDKTPGWMDEGQWVQRVFPVDDDFGGIGFFGYHPRSHMKEPSSRKAQLIGICLLKDWLCYLDNEAERFLEKTPSNFLRSRLLAASFPKACFIHIVRHPVATALSLKALSPYSPTIAWRSISSLIAHWSLCQNKALSDYIWLKENGRKVIVLAIEDIRILLPLISAKLTNDFGLPDAGKALSDSYEDNINLKYQQQIKADGFGKLPINNSTKTLLGKLGYSLYDLCKQPNYMEWL